MSLALAFGVPPMLLGIPGDNTYANCQEANRAFYRLTVLPLPLVRWVYRPESNTSLCTYHDKKFDCFFSVTFAGDYCPDGFLNY